jgi:hypothetical protein
MAHNEEMGVSMSRLCLYVLMATVMLPSMVWAQAKVDDVTTVGEQRVNEGAAAQREVEKLSDQTDDIEAEYKQVSKVVDGLKIYNGLLQKQVDNQVAEMAELSDSINKVSLIERQIVPLMVRMIEALAEFVALDVPFLSEERSSRVERLWAMMERSDVTAAEKFRRVLEAYQIENEYGRTIEAYKGTLEVDGGSREVNFLRVGRVVLLYQTDGGDLTGAWNQETQQWETLAPERYKQDVSKGLRVARKQVAPDLLVLPIAAAKGAAE